MPPIDYTAVLADLRARRDRLNAAIAAIEELPEVKASGAISPEEGADPDAAERPAVAVEVRTDSFFGLSASEAARKYLSMVKRPASVKEIHDALLAGGLLTTAKNFYSNLYTSIMRADEIVRVGKNWGLAEWYPGRRLEPKGGKRTPTNGAASEGGATETSANASEPPPEQSPAGAPE